MGESIEIWTLSNSTTGTIDPDIYHSIDSAHSLESCLEFAYNYVSCATDLITYDSKNNICRCVDVNTTSDTYGLITKTDDASFTTFDVTITSLEPSNNFLFTNLEKAHNPICL